MVWAVGSNSLGRSFGVRLEWTRKLYAAGRRRHTALGHHQGGLTHDMSYLSFGLFTESNVVDFPTTALKGAG